MLYLTLIICLGIISGLMLSSQKVKESEFMQTISYGEFVPVLLCLVVCGFSLLIIRSEALKEIAAGNPDPYVSLMALFVGVFIINFVQFLFTFFNVATGTVEESMETLSNMEVSDE